VTGCSDDRTPSAQTSPTDSSTSPATQSSGVVLDRYQGKGLCLVATPSTEAPSYKRFIADSERIDRLASDIDLVVIEIVDGKAGNVRGGPDLDQTSITRLLKQYVPDKSVMTAVVIGGNGKEILKQTGEVNVKMMLEGL
jgi:hypothetical protein